MVFDGDAQGWPPRLFARQKTKDIEPSTGLRRVFWEDSAFCVPCGSDWGIILSSDASRVLGGRAKVLHGMGSCTRLNKKVQ